MRISLFVLLLVCFCQSHAATYYVSSSMGDDGRPMAAAQHMGTPWKTLSRVGEMGGALQAGDSVLFKRGNVFPGSLSVASSGSPGRPVVFAAYGDGAMPELTGFVEVSGWRQKGGSVWEAVVPGGLSYLNTVTVNSVAKSVGRYPNAATANQGYLIYDSFNTNTSITDSKLAGQDWTGGQVVMRKVRWVIDRSGVSSQLGTTISYSSASGYWGATGYGYFVQNHPSALDTEGEWYYQGGKIGIFTVGDPNNSQVRAGVIETLVRVTGQSNLSFENLRLSGAAVSAFDISSSQNIHISSCEVLFSGRDGVDVTGTDGLIVENSTIAHTASNAIGVNNGNNTVLRGNQVRATGVYAGMGGGGDGTYEGVTISGDNNLIENNTIDSTGYVPLNFSGNNVTVKNNVVSNFAFVKDDGGGIYTWNNGANAPQNTGRVVTGNIILNGIGAPGGTDNPNKAYVHGIYIDDNAGQVEVSGNTVANCATYGIYVHNAHDIAIKQNTLYNNGLTQLVMEHDNVAADKPIYNCTVTGNVLFAKQTGQLSAEYKTKDNDIAGFGTFDNNYYYRPLDNDLTIGVLQQVNGIYGYQTLSVESWKALYGKDGSSAAPGHTVPAYIVTKVTGGNQYANGKFEGNTGGLYAYSAAGNCTAGWDSGHLDGGALKVSFSSTTDRPGYGSVVIGVGAVTAGKAYRLSFSMLGGDSHKAVTAYLRQSTGGYAELSARQSATISAVRAEKAFLLVSMASEGNASIVFDVPAQPSPVYLDNIRLEQVEATVTNPDSFLSFLYNTTNTAKTFNTSGIDVYNNNYINNINIQPFRSAIILKNASVDCPPLSKPIIVANE